MRQTYVGDRADFQRQVHDRLSRRLVELQDVPQYHPPAYAYHPNIRLRHNEGTSR